MAEVPVSSTHNPPPTPASMLTSPHHAQESISGSIQLPKQLESVKPAQQFCSVRHRWNTNEEIASILIAFSKHSEWQSHEIQQRPPSGCMLLFNRNNVRYRKDGYCWKKRRDGKTIREDHMKLKVQGLECIYGSYVHSGILPTFHRRCYYLLQNPDIVLVHYLNVPYPNNTKVSIPVLSFSMEKKEWTKEELIDQLKPMFSNLDVEQIQTMDETIHTLVQRLIETQNKHNSQHWNSHGTGDSTRLVVSKPGFSAIQPDTGAFKPSQNCCSISGSIPSTRANTTHSVLTGQSSGNQNIIDFAQSPLILNLGNVGNGRLMLVTGQGNTQQLSILTNTSTGQLQNWMNSGQGNSQTTVQVQPLPNQHQCFTQSLPQPGEAPSLSVTSDIKVLGQQQAGGCSGNGHLAVGCQSDISHVHGKSPNTVCVHTCGCSSNATVCKDNLGGHPVQIDGQSSTSMQKFTVSDGSASTQNQDTSETIQQNLYTKLPDNTFDSLVDELQLELMATDKGTPTDDGSKQGFEHLGDSFDNLHASLQGSDLNLDQLDLITMPDFEKMCNDLSNSSNMGTNNSGMVSSVGNLASESSDGISVVSKNIESGSVLGDLNLNNIDANPITQNSFGVTHDLSVNRANQATSFVKAEGHTMSSCHNVPVVPAGTVTEQQVKAQHMSHTTKSPSTIAMITDFSPDWAYTEGQTKVLVTGPWHSNMGTYTVHIDSKMIATTLVQPGVLRCFVPGHSSGLVTLNVSCDNTVISNSVVFEYRERPKHVQLDATAILQSDWFSVDDIKLKEQLIAKLKVMESALSKVPDFPSVTQSFLGSPTLENVTDLCLTRHLESFATRLWTTNDFTPDNATMGLSLLHLVAALGYERFTHTLIKWRTDNPSWLLEYEVDAHSTDQNTCTPLMWACARGHTSSAIALYKWNKTPLHSFNREGNLPLFVARQHGHHSLADQLEHLEASGDLSHDQSSSQSHKNISSTSIYTDYFESQPMCSTNMLPLEPPEPSPEKTYFTNSDFPVATSTPILTENPENVPEPFKASRSDSTGAQSLGALHIDIPEQNAQSSTPQQQKRDKLLRRQSDQMLGMSSMTASSGVSSSTTSSSSLALTSAERRQKLKKRLSVDIISHQSLEPVHFSPTTAFQRPVREASSEPHLSVNMEEHLLCQTNPMLSEGREISSPEIMMQMEACERQRADRQTNQDTTTQPVNMDTDDVSEGSATSFIDVERVSDDENAQDLRLMSHGGEIENPQHQMVHLAKQIIAAMPERIKSSPSRGDDIMPEEFERERSSSYSSLQSASPHASSSYGEALSSYGEGMSSYGEDSGISTPMKDSLAFDEYRYSDVYSDLGTPASSLSPDSTYLHSPYSPYSFNLDSPPPTAAEFIEYFNAPATYMEKDFSQLTLSDREQRKLYEAAKVIQSAYRQYRVQCKQQNREKEAAVLIQSYYRRYKQYAYYKKMTQAAVLIQSQFRSYYAQKRFKKSRDAAVVIQNQYRSYKEHERLKKGGNKSVIQRYRSHYQRKPAGAGKGSRVVQIVPDKGDGSQPEPASTVIEECPQDSADVEEGSGSREEQGEVTVADPDKGK